MALRAPLPIGKGSQGPDETAELVAAVPVSAPPGALIQRETPPAAEVNEADRALRRLHLLVRSARFYERHHPHTLENLDGANGFLFDPAGDPAQLADRISPFFQDPTNWERLSTAARATIEKQFSWNYAADLYEKLLTEQPRMNADKHK